MRIKKKLYWDLMGQLLLFLISAVIITGLFIGALILITMNTLSKYPDEINALNNRFTDVRFDGKVLETMDIEEGTWIEILKDNQVIYRQGRPNRNKESYSQSELNDIANNVDELSIKSDYVYEYNLFQGLDGENYTLLHIRPKVSNGIFKLEMNNSRNENSVIQQELNRNILILLTTFMVLIIIMLLLLSRLTTKKLIKPLNALSDGLHTVIQGDYSQRLSFKGNYEFNQLRDAFNYMTEKLETVEKENREITESKRRLLLDISHDLRTPATTIQGYAEALANDVVVDPEKRKKYLVYIYKKSKHLTDLIERLFEFSKLDSRIYDMNKEVKDIGEFLRNVIIGFYGELEKKHFFLNIDIPEKPVFFEFDEIEMHRALANIINNIMKYNERETSLYVVLEEGEDYVRIRIGDDGIGIPEHIKSNVFNALVRGDNIRKSDGGTGLGLAITKKIIGLHQGTIHIDNQWDKGSMFIIEFIRKKDLL